MESFFEYRQLYQSFLSKQICRTTLIDKKASKLSERYIVQGIAILANEHLEPQKCRNCCGRIQEASPQDDADWLMRAMRQCPKKQARRAQLIGLTRTALSAKLSTIVKSLCIARVLRHFVLVPCEICVKKLLLTETIYLSRILRSQTISLIHACASLCSFKHGYLSLQKYSLQQYFIKKLPLPILLHNLRIYPQSTS